MEFAKLVAKGRGKSRKKIWTLRAEIDEKNDKVTMISEFGELGGKLKTFEKILTSAHFKKGVHTLKKLAQDEAKSLINRKLREGYSEMKNADLDKQINEDDERADMGDEEYELYMQNKKNANSSSSSSSSSSSDSEDEKENKENKEDKKEDNKDEDYKEEDDNKISNKKEKHHKGKRPARCYYPMLAHPFTVRKKEIKYPCYVQPKLDGVRCIAVGTEIYSRNGLPFQTLNHIKAELKRNTDHLILDGELYTDDINFQKISGLVKRINNITKEDEKDLLKIYYNVFDYIDEKTPMEERFEKLNKFFQNNKDMKYIRQVVTEECTSEQNVFEYLEKYTKDGFEGVIIRNKNGLYEENLRSVNLQKLKKFHDEEFEIVDFFTPKKGKEVGCVIWICQTKDGKRFNARPLGSFEDRKMWYENGKKYIGKMLTVKYQELTNDGRPRFPVGIAIRDYE